MLYQLFENYHNLTKQQIYQLVDRLHLIHINPTSFHLPTNPLQV
nr:MAG TPA: hypothetical protein [Caudoviricetes sp.]